MYYIGMNQPQELTPGIKEQFEALTNVDAEASVAVRGVYRFYFDSKPTATTHDKQFLLGQSFAFAAASGLPMSEERVIFDEEAQRYRDLHQRAKPKA